MPWRKSHLALGPIGGRSDAVTPDRLVEIPREYPFLAFEGFDSAGKMEILGIAAENARRRLRSMLAYRWNGLCLIEVL